MVDVIDTSLHVTAFPTGYTGLGTLIGNANNAGGVTSTVSCFFTSTGAAVDLLIGFRPRKISIINDTDSIQWDWIRGMAATHAKKTVFSGPTITMDTGSAIVPSEPSLNTGNWKVTLSATLAGTSKLICVWIEG